MTKITYWAAVLNKKDTERNGYPCGRVGLHTDIVIGGEEELQKRKQEIIDEHNQQVGSVILHDFYTGKELGKHPGVKFLQEVRDYQEFQI